LPLLTALGSIALLTALGSIAPSKSTSEDASESTSEKALQSDERCMVTRDEWRLTAPCWQRSAGKMSRVTLLTALGSTATSWNASEEANEKADEKARQSERR
jgi:hypothetical protein